MSRSTLGLGPHYNGSMPPTIDDALEIVHGTGPEYGPGLSNHAPMGAEALVAMGRVDSVVAWVEEYVSELQPTPKSVRPISHEDWREALGDIRRFADWVAFFDRALVEAPWQSLLAEWVPLLAPSIMAAATHGLLRTAHAARSLAESETPLRIHEFAQGLGYWAARYQELPGRPSADDSTELPSDAVRRLRRVHGPGFEEQGPIFEELRGLDDEPDFESAIGLSGPSDDLSAFLSDLTETFAGLYLVNDSSPIAFVHTVTAPSSLRLIAPYLDEADARLIARYLWQACAAIYAWYGVRDPAPHTAPDVLYHDRDDLVDRALHARGPHTIKFTEACLRENAINQSPVYLSAARDAADRVGPY